MISRKSKIAARRKRLLDKATELLGLMANGQLDAYQGYRQLYGVFIASGGSLSEIKLFFRIDGVEPDGRLSPTPEFRDMVKTMARDWLLKNSISADYGSTHESKRPRRV